MTSYYAVIQQGFCILGFGDTESASIQDAIERGHNPRLIKLLLNYQTPFNYDQDCSLSMRLQGLHSS